MKEFIKATKKQIRAHNQANIDNFIDCFNRAIHKGYEEAYHLNTGLDKIPPLTDGEFELVCKQAEQNGYLLTRYDDNYQTISYKLSLVSLLKR